MTLASSSFSYPFSCLFWRFYLLWPFDYVLVQSIANELVQFHCSTRQNRDFLHVHQSVARMKSYRRFRLLNLQLNLLNRKKKFIFKLMAFIFNREIFEINILWKTSYLSMVPSFVQAVWIECLVASPKCTSEYWCRTKIGTILVKIYYSCALSSYNWLL